MRLPRVGILQVTFPGDEWVVREKGVERRVLRRYVATAERVQAVTVGRLPGAQSLLVWLV